MSSSTRVTASPRHEAPSLSLRSPRTRIRDRRGRAQTARDRSCRSIAARISARAHSLPTTSGEQAMLDGMDAAAQRLEYRRRGREPARSRSPGPCRCPRPRSARSRPPRSAGGEQVLERMSAGEVGQRRGMDVHDALRKALEERRCQEVHVPGAARRARRRVPRASPPSPSPASPDRHSRRARTLLAGTPADSARASALARRVLDATATTGKSASSSACEFVPSPLTRTPITRASIVPMTRASPGSGTTAHEADPEIENAPELVLVHMSSSHSNTGGRSQDDQSSSAPRPPAGRARGCPRCHRR